MKSEKFSHSNISDNRLDVYERVIQAFEETLGITSHVEIAKRLGYKNRSRMTSYKSGKARIPHKEILKISEVTGRSVNWLLTGEVFQGNADSTISGHKILLEESNRLIQDGHLQVAANLLWIALKFALGQTLRMSEEETAQARLDYLIKRVTEAGFKIIESKIIACSTILQDAMRNQSNVELGRINLMKDLVIEIIGTLNKRDTIRVQRLAKF